MKITLLLFTVLILNSCAYLRLGSQHTPEGRINYKVKNVEYLSSVNGRVLKNNKRRNKKALKRTVEYIEDKLDNESGEEIDVKIVMDSRVTQSTDFTVKDTKRNKVIKSDYRTTWIMASIYTLTIIPYFEIERYTANVSITKNGKLMCEKSCPGKYFYLMFFPLILATPINIFYNEKVYANELIGACMEQCLAAK